jgi:hypothetical protein
MNRKSITAFVVALSLFTVAGGQHMLADAGQGGIGGLQLPNRRVCYTNGDTKSYTDSCPMPSCTALCRKYSWTSGNGCQPGLIWDNCVGNGFQTVHVNVQYHQCHLSGPGCACNGLQYSQWEYIHVPTC